MFLRGKEIDLFNDELGVVEHIFTAATNYGIGQSFTEKFQAKTSSGDDSLDTPSCPCGSVTYHIEDAGGGPAGAASPPNRFWNPLPITADIGKLVNNDPLTQIGVTLDNTTTTGNKVPEELAKQLQAAINDALDASGATPGFMSGTIGASGTFTATYVPFGAPQFITQGPHIHFGQEAGMPDNPVQGAIQTVVVFPASSPTTPAIPGTSGGSGTPATPGAGDSVWVGGVNGGVWRTDNANATGFGNVVWRALLDVGPQMSIGALALDPTGDIRNANHAVLVAGIADTSSFHSGSALTGLVRTTDGGATWTQLGIKDLFGLNVTGVVARGNVILVSATGTNGGVWRSTDAGATFTPLSGNALVYGLPAGAAYDLEGDPFDSAGNIGNLTRVYALMDGAGVYRTDDLGDHWDAAGGANFGTATSLFLSHAPALGGGNLTTVNAKLAVRPDAPGDTVYAALTIHLDGSSQLERRYQLHGTDIPLRLHRRKLQLNHRQRYGRSQHAARGLPRDGGQRAG